MFVVQPGIRIRTTGAAVVTLLALCTFGFGQKPMQSPVDSTDNPSIEVATTAAQNAAATNIMLGWMTENLGAQLAMKDPMHEFALTNLFKDRTNQWNGQLTQMFKLWFEVQQSLTGIDFKRIEALTSNKALNAAVKALLKKRKLSQQFDRAR